RVGSEQLGEDLATGPAGHERLRLVGSPSEDGDSDGDEVPMPSRHRREDRRALGTEPEPVRRILDIAAPDHDAVGRRHRRADGEAGIRAVRLGGGRPRLGKELLLVDGHGVLLWYLFWNPGQLVPWPEPGQS